MARITPIKDAWRDFEHRCVPGDAGENQRKQTRQAFYAGAISVNIINDAIGEPECSEAQGMVLLSAVRRDIEEFLESRIGGHVLR